MSEAPVISLAWDERESSQAGSTSTSVGELLPNIEAKVVDDETEIKELGKPGELWVRISVTFGFFRPGWMSRFYSVHLFYATPSAREKQTLTHEIA